MSKTHHPKEPKEPKEDETEEAEEEAEERHERRRSKTPMELAREWGTILAAVGALTGSGANYIGAGQQEQKQLEAQAQTLAQLDSAYKAMKTAMEAVEKASHERDEKVMALREAIAELRGVVGTLGSKAQQAAARAGQRLEEVDGDGVQEAIELPEELPEPAPEAVQEKMRSLKK